MDLKAEETPLQNITAAIATVTGIQFIIPRGINPPVSLEVKNIPIERALEQVFRLALGSEKNVAMVYTERLDSSGRNRVVLSEVRVIGTGLSSGLAPSPRSGSTPPAVSPQNPKKPNTRPDLRSMQESRKKARERKFRSRPGSSEMGRAGRVPER